MNRQKVTSVVALHNFMTKLHGAAVYELLSKFGKSHNPWFRYRCEAMDEEVIGTGRSKGNAKQIVARMMLEQLSLRGYVVPPEFASPQAMHALLDHAGLPTHSFVVLVNELCEQYRLDPVEYEVFADPAGQPSFTVKARIGYVERVATGSSKRIAQHLAAEQIYKHLRSNLSGTRGFNEELTLYRAYERAMAPTSDEDTPDEQQRPQEEQAAAVRRTSRRNRKNKNKRSAAVQASVSLELEQPEQGGYEVGPEAPPSNEALGLADNNIAMNFISRTMERLGI